MSELMRTLSSYVSLSASQQGTLKLSLSDQHVEGSACWFQLEHPQVHTQANDNHASNTSPDAFHEVHISMKAMQNVFSCASMAKSTVACICAGYCVVFYVYISGASQHRSIHQTNGPQQVRGVVNVRMHMLPFPPRFQNSLWARMWLLTDLPRSLPSCLLFWGFICFFLFFIDVSLLSQA